MSEQSNFQSAVTNNSKMMIIVNPLSNVGKNKDSLQLIKDELKASAIEHEIFFSEYAGHSIELAKKAVKEKYSCVVAVGGDGTVNEVGQNLIDTNIAMGIIPSGSGNGLARHLGIPMNLKKSLQILISGKFRNIDTASLNGKVFLSTAGIGFDAHVGWKFAEFGKRGLLSYMHISALEFFNYKPRSYILEIDGKIIKSKAFLISFANSGQFGNNAWIAPDAKIDDGYLNVCILDKFPITDLAELIYRLFTKNLSGSKYYHIHKAKEIKVKKGHNMVHLDGEPKLETTELQIKVKPASMKVIC